MGPTSAEVEAAVREFVAKANKPATFDLDTTLYADGIGLDSLETAELSAVLEDEFGTDPFSGGEMPNTVGDILAYYAALPSAR